jgi:hypothetical protein
LYPPAYCPKQSFEFGRRELAVQAMSEALSDPEDTVNDALEKRMQARKMLTNSSYFAFTAASEFVSEFISKMTSGT